MSAAKAKGTRAERQVAEYLQESGWPYTERRAMAGRNDHGDISGLPGVVIEVKAAARMELAMWLGEAHAERVAPADIALVWHKRRGKGSPADWYVTMDGATAVELLRAWTEE